MPPLEPSPSISIVVPTYKEVESLPYLLDRLAALRSRTGLDFEVLVMDDASGDGSKELIAARAEPWVTFVERGGERGLSAAVLDGFARAKGDFLVCMDADLSHPPEQIPELIAQLEAGNDFVVGSRYVKGGTTSDDWGFLRWANSLIATLLARPFTSISDPMSGFFALRRSTYERADELNPVGYKVGLELIVKCRCQRVVEIPIHFEDRQHGESKLTFTQQLLYLRHLRRLSIYKFGVWTNLMQFLAVGSIGAVVNLVTLTLLTWAGTSVHFALFGGLVVSICSNFLLNRRFTFSYARGGHWVQQFSSFVAASSLAAAVNYAVSIFVLRLSPGTMPQVAASLGIIAGTGINFVANRFFVFRAKHVVPIARADAPARPTFGQSFARVAGIVILVKLALLAVSWSSVSTPGGTERHLWGSADAIPLFAWDSQHYLEILKHGYASGAALGALEFFPLYPLLSWPLSHVLGGAGSLLLTANLTSLFGYCLFHLWSWRASDERTALLATLLALAYPPAFYVSCAYAEAPLLFAVAATLILTQDKRFAWAGGVTFLAGALHPSGLLLSLLPAAAALISGWHAGPRARLRSMLAAALLSASGPCGFLAGHALATARHADSVGSVEVDAKARAHSARIASTSGIAVEAPPASEHVLVPERVGHEETSFRIGNVVFAWALAVISSVALWVPGVVPRLGLLFCLCLFATAYLPGGTGVAAVARTLAVALPCFLFLAQYARRWPRTAYASIALLGLAQLAYVAAFSRGIWTG